MKDNELKIGDMVRLKTIEKLKSQYKCSVKQNGISIERLHINSDMMNMFGKEWRVYKTMPNHSGRGYDFDIEGPAGYWAFSKKWIETHKDIIDVDNLFEELELNL